MVVLFFIGFLVVCLAVDAIIQYRRSKEAAPKAASSLAQKILDPNAIIVPDGIYFDKSHTWAYMEKDGKVQVGINDLLQRTTGDISNIILKNPGEEIKKGEPFLSIIQKGKKLEVYSPISGKISSYNNQLKTNSGLINSAPYSEGWIYKINPTNWLNESKFMIMTEKASQWIKNEYSRFKDFFITCAQANQIGQTQIILQEGGSLKDNILCDLGPEVWEDFQSKILDKNN